MLLARAKIIFIVVGGKPVLSVSPLLRRAVGPAVVVALSVTSAGFGGSPEAATTRLAIPHDVVGMPVLTADQPPKAVVNGGPGVISPIVLANDAAAGPLVFTLAGHGTFDTSHLVTVTVTQGEATVAAATWGPSATTASVVPTATTLTVYVTPRNGPSTFQLSDVAVTSTDRGPVTVSVNDGTATYGPVTATAAVKTSRLAGSDRYGTAAAMFTDAFSCAATNAKGTSGDGTSAAMIARGDAFADALASDYGAAQMPSGTLLTTPTTVPQATLDALKAAGVTDVVVVGGTAAISEAVVQKLGSTEAYSCSGDAGRKIGVLRIAGDDRYETAALVAELASMDDAGNPTNVGTAALNGGTTPLATAVLATGTNFPDALAAGPMAYWGDNLPSEGNQRPFPLLLTAAGGLPAVTKAALGDLKIKQVIVVGGTGAVSDTVAGQLTAMGIRPIRLSGATRTETATAVARFETAGTDGTDNSGLGYDANGIAIARADTFPDALAGGPWVGAHVSPVLLAESPATLGTDAHDYLASVTASKVAAVVALGGESAVTNDTLQAAADALAGPSSAVMSPSLRTATSSSRMPRQGSGSAWWLGEGRS